MANTITVRSKLATAPDGGDPVALWEPDAAHPDGECFVAGPTPVEVAETVAVQQAIAEGRLEKVEGKAAAAKA